MTRAKYAPVGPIAILQALEDNGILGDYVLLIASDILKHKNEYEAIFNNSDDLWKWEGHIIVDNGAIENGVPSPIDHCLLACDVVNADVLIVPDEIGDSRGTIRLAHHVKEYLVGPDTPEVMCIPQGQTYEEIRDCIHELEGILHPDWWGIPRHITNNLGTREIVVQYLQRFNKPMHLLGMSQDMDDDIRCTRYTGVRGIDSANPIVLGLLDIPLESGHMYHHADRQREGWHYWHQTNINHQVFANVIRMRAYVDG